MISAHFFPRSCTLLKCLRQLAVDLLTALFTLLKQELMTPSVTQPYIGGAPKHDYTYSLLLILR
jgi:hypothetical protein